MDLNNLQGFTGSAASFVLFHMTFGGNKGKEEQGSIQRPSNRAGRRKEVILPLILLLIYSQKIQILWMLGGFIVVLNDSFDL